MPSARHHRRVIKLSILGAVGGLPLCFVALFAEHLILAGLLAIVCLSSILVLLMEAGRHTTSLEAETRRLAFYSVENQVLFAAQVSEWPFRTRPVHMLAIYRDCLVTCRLPLSVDIPQAAYAADGHSAWSTLPQARRFRIFELTDLASASTHDRKFPRPATSVRLRFAQDIVAITLDPLNGSMVKDHLLTHYGDLLDTRAESVHDARSKSFWTTIGGCIAGTALLIWMALDPPSRAAGPFIGPMMIEIYQVHGTRGTVICTSVACLFVGSLTAIVAYAAPLGSDHAITATTNCGRCGYDLRGTTTGRCPECGHPAAPR